MTSYVALLRGVNVGGKVAKMETVRGSFEALGFGQVSTYVQSGNVLFHTKAAGGAALAKKIAARLEKDIGFAPAVLVLSATELARVIADNPFAKEKGIDPTKLHVTFLDGPAPGAGLEKMKGFASSHERFVCRGTAIYLHCPDGYGRSKLSNNVFERVLEVGATTRNWKTVTTLAALVEKSP
ncbi:MAG TPA: DUF1697 domain-containing protein [Polyangia bacterium]|nr:DUF1697 domain-containing protein [Polyangia bacterium]